MYHQKFCSLSIAACIGLIIQSISCQALAQPNSQIAQPQGNVDLNRSRAYIFVGKTGFGHDHGVEGKLKSGAIQLGAATNAGQLVFDMMSFDADTPTARRYVGLAGTTDASTRQQVNANMKGADVLNVARYPTATFDIHSAESLNQKTRNGHAIYRITGDFTLHGVKNRIQFNAVAMPLGQQVRLSGSFVVRQTQFGITPFSKAFGAVGVADALKIYGDIVIDPPAAGSPATSSTTTGIPAGGVR